MPPSAVAVSSAARASAPKSRTSASKLSARRPCSSHEALGFREVLGCRRADRGMLDRAARAEVEQRDVGALGGQGHGVTATLAAAGAGDERDLSFEAAHHCAVMAS